VADKTGRGKGGTGTGWQTVAKGQSGRQAGARVAQGQSGKQAGARVAQGQGGKQAGTRHRWQ
jgi:hypothetical protein